MTAWNSMNYITLISRPAELNKIQSESWIPDRCTQLDGHAIHECLREGLLGLKSLTLKEGHQLKAEVDDHLFSLERKYSLLFSFVFLVCCRSVDWFAGFVGEENRRLSLISVLWRRCVYVGFWKIGFPFTAKDTSPTAGGRLREWTTNLLYQYLSPLNERDISSWFILESN